MRECVYTHVLCKAPAANHSELSPLGDSLPGGIA